MNNLSFTFAVAQLTCDKIPFLTHNIIICSARHIWRTQLVISHYETLIVLMFDTKSCHTNHSGMERVVGWMGEVGGHGGGGGRGSKHHPHHLQRLWPVITTTLTPHHIHCKTWVKYAEINLFSFSTLCCYPGLFSSLHTCRKKKCF